MPKPIKDSRGECRSLNTALQMESTILQVIIAKAPWLNMAVIVSNHFNPVSLIVAHQSKQVSITTLMSHARAAPSTPTN